MATGLDLEEEYWRWRERQKLLIWDRLIAWLGGLVHLAAASQGVSRWYCLQIAVVMAGVAVVSFCKPDWYLQYRSGLLMLARISLALIQACNDQVLEGVEEETLLWPVSCPAWLLVGFLAVGWQLPISQHLAVQSAVALLTCGTNSQELCSRNQHLLNSVARGLDAVGPALLSVSWLLQPGVFYLPASLIPKQTGSNCWGVTVFMSLWFGWLLPTIWVWLAERASRREFLTVECRERFGLKMSLPKPTLLARFIWCCNVFLLVEVSWRILRQAEKSLFMAT